MTAAQQSLWPDLVEPVYVPGLTLDERFAVWHALNPHVADRLRVMALELVAHGRDRIGMKMLVEVLRWQQWIDTIGAPYVINNSYVSRLARLLMDTTPELRDVFETRALAAACPEAASFRKPRVAS